MSWRDSRCDGPGARSAHGPPRPARTIVTAAADRRGLGPGHRGLAPWRRPPPAVTSRRELEALLLDGAEARRGHVCVVLDPGVLADLGQRRLHAQGDAIRPVRGHGFHDVGHGEDPRLGQDIGSRQRPGVARAVEALVVLQLSLIHISEPTRLLSISYAVFCLKKKKTNHTQKPKPQK